MTDTPASELLSWYDQHARALPWRALPGAYADPYHVWLSEIMLQQTNVTTVKPYFEKFLRLFPRVEDLAAAPDTDVMAAWAGLGYYSRARNLLKCARLIHTDYQGEFPDTQDALLALPGIGPYTRRRRLRPSPSTAPPPQSMEILNACCRGSTSTPHRYRL